MVGLDWVTQKPGAKNDLEAAMGTEEEAAHHPPDLPWAQGPMGGWGQYEAGRGWEEARRRKLQRGLCAWE